MAQSISNEFRSLLGKSRQWVAEVVIVDRNGQPILSTATDGPMGQRITVSHLRITYDRSRSVRGAADCVIDLGYDPSGEISMLVPTMGDSLLSPVSGATFRVRAGFIMPSTGMPELVACGTFDVESCVVDEIEGGVQISIGGQDLTGRLDVADLYTPVPFSSGGSFLDLVEFLILTTIPSATFLEDTTPYLIPFNGTLNPGKNRLAEITRILKAIGMELYADPTGPFAIRNVPTTADAAAWELTEGDFTVLVSASSSMDRTRVKNGVIAEGQNLVANTKCYAAVWNEDLADPTHFIDSIPVQTIIGPRPAFITSEFITTNAQALDAATAELRRIMGLMQRGQFVATANPAMNVGDVIYINRPAVGIVGTCLVQRVEIVGEASTMRISCEERRV